jgi:hypothetical protein
MPGASEIKLRGIGPVYSCISSADAVEITVASGAGAGWIVRFMTRGAIFYIVPGVPAVISSP